MSVIPVKTGMTTVAISNLKLASSSEYAVQFGHVLWREITIPQLLYPPLTTLGYDRPTPMASERQALRGLVISLSQVLPGDCPNQYYYRSLHRRLFWCPYQHQNRHSAVDCPRPAKQRHFIITSFSVLLTVTLPAVAVTLYMYTPPASPAPSQVEPSGISW